MDVPFPGSVDRTERCSGVWFRETVDDGKGLDECFGRVHSLSQDECTCEVGSPCLTVNSISPTITYKHLADLFISYQCVTCKMLPSHYSIGTVEQWSRAKQ